MAGCGLEKVSSAQRVASNSDSSPAAFSARFSPTRLLPVATARKYLQHLGYAIEQGQLVVLGQVVIAVALHHARIIFRIHIRHDSLHGFIQAQADHMRGRLFARYRQAQIPGGSLYAPDYR
jgi:hypothetical protein